MLVILPTAGSCMTWIPSGRLFIFSMWDNSEEFFTGIRKERSRSQQDILMSLLGWSNPSPSVTLTLSSGLNFHLSVDNPVTLSSSGSFCLSFSHLLVTFPFMCLSIIPFQHREKNSVFLFQITALIYTSKTANSALFTNPNHYPDYPFIGPIQPLRSCDPVISCLSLIQFVPFFLSW